MKKFAWILVLLLIGIIIAQNIFIKPKPIIRKKILHTVDTIITTKKEYVPVPYFRDTGSTKYIHDTTEVPSRVDTAAILADYIRVRLDMDTLLNDSSGFILINDKIQYNRIVSRIPTIRIYNHNKTITNPPRKIFLVGLGVGYNFNHFGFSARGLFIDRRRHAYGLSYDPVNKFFEISLLWPIKK